MLGDSKCSGLWFYILSDSTSTMLLLLGNLFTDSKRMPLLMPCKNFPLQNRQRIFCKMAFQKITKHVKFAKHEKSIKTVPSWGRLTLMIVATSFGALLIQESISLMLCRAKLLLVTHVRTVDDPQYQHWQNATNEYKYRLNRLSEPQSTI